MCNQSTPIKGATASFHPSPRPSSYLLLGDDGRAMVVATSYLSHGQAYARLRDKRELLDLPWQGHVHVHAVPQLTVLAKARGPHLLEEGGCLDLGIILSFGDNEAYDKTRPQVE